MHKEHTIIIGSGPCGLSCAIALQNKGLSPLIIEKENIVNTIYQFPTHQTFFSTSEKLEIGDVPFITDLQSPVRSQALAYYRSVVKRKQIRIHAFEEVEKIEQSPQGFLLQTKKHTGESIEYAAENIIIATGYYDQPNRMHIPGEHLNKVMHYFKEAHPYYDQHVTVIGGKNSAVDTTLELHKAGAHITVLYRGENYSKSIKPWILPKFDALAQKGMINMEFNAEVIEITNDEVVYIVDGQQKRMKNDFVFAMTGYHPNTKLLREIGVHVNNQNGIPTYNETTMETNIPKCYIAGVVAAGIHNNAIFIENGRQHGEQIAQAITRSNNDTSHR